MFIEENPHTLKDGEMSNLDTIAHLRAVNAKLLEALSSLNRWGHHDHDCIPDVYDEGVPCPCGFNLAMDQARAAIEEAKK